MFSEVWPLFERFLTCTTIIQDGIYRMRGSIQAPSILSVWFNLLSWTLLICFSNAGKESNAAEHSLHTWEPFSWDALCHLNWKRFGNSAVQPGKSHWLGMNTCTYKSKVMSLILPWHEGKHAPFHDAVDAVLWQMTMYSYQTNSENPWYSSVISGELLNDWIENKLYRSQHVCIQKVSRGCCFDCE